MEGKKTIYYGALYTTLGYFCLAVLSLFSKLMGSQVSIFTILLFQNGICLLLTLPQIFKEGISHLKTHRIGTHLVRDVAGVLSFLFLFFSLKHVPLVTGTLLLNTAPLWLPLIAWLWLKVKIPGRLWWGLIIGFIGVGVILKPGAAAFSLGSLAALFSGILLGFALLVIHQLRTTEPTNRILFYYFLVGTVISAPLALIEFIPPSFKDLLLLIGIGVFTYLAQLLVTYAFKFGKAEILAPLAYTVVIFSALFDWIFWDNTPSFLTCFGALLIIIGAILSLHFESRRQKNLSKAL